MLLDYFKLMEESYQFWDEKLVVLLLGKLRSDNYLDNLGNEVLDD